MSDFLIRITESLLTYRKRRKARRKEKKRQSSLPFLLRMLGEFLWAAVFVLLINQFLLQAYVIPSGSMLPVLQLQDRIFVNKFIFGPELLPGSVKIPRFRDPRRGEIVIFENPTYVGRGPVFTILQRMIYMLTLSFVDIDRDEMGRPKAQLLIKRAVGMEGDTLRYDDGQWLIRPAGTSEWMKEEEFTYLNEYPFEVQRLVKTEDIALSELGGQISTRLMHAIPLSTLQRAKEAEVRSLASLDVHAFERGSVEELFILYPENRLASQRYRLLQRGWYVPEGYFLPLGDNRDNSRDGRYFGPVEMREILGTAWFRYWPGTRIGGIQNKPK